MRPTLSILRTALLGGALLGSGCEALQPGGALLYVFSTHHATPEADGSFPDRGDDTQPRVFDNDEGWEITLVQSYITISAVEIVDCRGRVRNLRMFWGPCPEDIRGEDLETLTVAGIELPEGSYCELRLHYGPYSAPVIDPDNPETRHDIPAIEDVHGSTLFFEGGASKGGNDAIPFSLSNGAQLQVSLDLSQLDDGSPFHINHTEAFPKELTVSKTYDRFFDGVEFDAYDQNSVEDDLDEILRDQTRVQIGQSVNLDSPQ